MTRIRKEKKEIEPKLILVIRIRGSVNVNYKIEDTLKMLRLHRVNHGVLLFADKTIHGMLRKIRDYVAYGEIEQKVLLQLLIKRSMIQGNKKLTEEHLKNKTDYSTLSDLAKALMKGKVSVKEIYKMKPIFRLHPPRGGFRGTIKKHFNAGGILGHVGNYINKLAIKMI